VTRLERTATTKQTARARHGAAQRGARRGSSVRRVALQCSAEANAARVSDLPPQHPAPRSTSTTHPALRLCATRERAQRRCSSDSALRRHRNATSALCFTARTPQNAPSARDTAAERARRLLTSPGRVRPAIALSFADVSVRVVSRSRAFPRDAGL
jgi:hypothetical protein